DLRIDVDQGADFGPLVAEKAVDVVTAASVHTDDADAKRFIGCHGSSGSRGGGERRSSGSGGQKRVELATIDLRHQKASAGVEGEGAARTRESGRASAI